MKINYWSHDPNEIWSRSENGGRTEGQNFRLGEKSLNKSIICSFWSSRLCLSFRMELIIKGESVVRSAFDLPTYQVKKCGYVLFKDFYLRTEGQRTWSSKDQGL